MAYGYFRSLTVGTITGGPHTNFPVLVYLNDPSFKLVGSGGKIQNSTTQASGPAVTMPADLIFTSDSGGLTQLPFEIDSWDSTNGILWAWVKISSCNTGTVFYIFYGDASVNTPQNTGSFTPANVWDTNYKVVYHIGDGTTYRTGNSTSISLPLTNNSATITTGKIDGGGSFNGTSSGNVTSAGLDLTSTNKITVECWLNWTTFANNDKLLFESGANAFSAGDGTIFADPNESSSGKFQIATKHSTILSSAEFTRPSAGAFHHYAFVFDKSQATAAAQYTIYVDGVSVAFTQLNSFVVPGNFGNFVLNLMCRNQASLFGTGILDEFRVSLNVRSANWIKSGFDNQDSPSTFMTVGSEQLVGSGTLIGASIKQFNRNIRTIGGR